MRAPRYRTPRKVKILWGIMLMLYTFAWIIFGILVCTVRH